MVHIFQTTQNLVISRCCFAEDGKEITKNDNICAQSLFSSLNLCLISIIIWLALQVAKMIQIACCDWLPERARWSHLARSGLPAVSCKKNFPESHIISPLLTKFVRSRWLDIGLDLFCEVMDLNFVSVRTAISKNVAKRKANIP